LGDFEPPSALSPYVMVFDRRIVHQLLLHIARRFPGRSFEEAVFDSIDLEHPDGFGAFETYGWFAAQAAPQRIAWRTTGTIRFPKDRAGMHESCAAEARRRQCDAVYYQPCWLQEVDDFLVEASKFIDPQDVKIMLDLGSRDAEVSLAAKRHLPNARLWAFECNPDAIQLCRANLRGRNDITLVERAVSNVPGPVDFYAINPLRTKTPHSDGNIGASSLFRASADYPYEQYEQDKITVLAVTLGEWAKEAGIEEIDLMWMDLQGAEVHALQGLGDLLTRVKIIYTEVEYKQMYHGQPLGQELRDLLISRGFRLHKKFNTGEWFGNEMFVRQDIRERRQGPREPSAVQIIGKAANGAPIISFCRPVVSP
jgi:FkbM family methyltransferase